jgi:cytoskeletal protein RodZ
MTENKKPEWFELTDGSAPSAQVAKVNKFLPVTAALIAGAVIATGAFLANASQSDSQGQEIAQTATVATPSESSSTPGATGNTAPTAPTAPTQGGVAKPDANRGGAEHEDRDDHEWYDIFGDDDDHEEGEEHEGRRHHERGERGDDAPAIPSAGA